MKAKSIFICFLLLILTAACQPSAPENVPQQTQVQGVKSTQAQPAQGAATVSAEKPTGGSGEFSMNDFEVGLDQLSSYRQSMVLGFDGAVSGAETHTQTSIRRTMMREPAVQLTWVEIDGIPLQMYGKVGEVSYLQAGADGACNSSTAVPESDGSMAAFQLQSLPAVAGASASAAGEETVNGVASTHYTFDENAIGRAGEVKAAGDVWVAKDGGYVVKYSLNLVGENDQLGPGVSGTQTWTYDLTDAGAVSAPDLPAGCTAEQGAEIAPLLPDAKDIMRMPNFLQFSAAVAHDQAAQFYKDQAAALEWEEALVQTEPGADQILNFKTPQGGLVNIRIHAQETGSRVTIQTLQGKQE